MANTKSEFIRIDDSQIKKLGQLFSGVFPKELERAKRNAMIGVRKGAKQRTSQWIRTKGKVKYNLPAARANRGIWVTNYVRGSFFVIGSKKPISLTSFSGTKKLQNGKPSVKVSSKTGRVHFTKSFIAPALGGAEQVFTRYSRNGGTLGERIMRKGRYAGKKRGVIRALKGPSIADMMLTNDVEEELAKFLQERYDRELANSVKNILNRRL